MGEPTHMEGFRCKWDREVLWSLGFSSKADGKVSSLMSFLWIRFQFLMLNHLTVPRSSTKAPVARTLFSESPVAVVLAPAGAAVRVHLSGVASWDVGCRGLGWKPKSFWVQGPGLSTWCIMFPVFPSECLGSSARLVCLPCKWQLAGMAGSISKGTTFPHDDCKVRAEYRISGLEGAPTPRALVLICLLVAVGQQLLLVMMRKVGSFSSIISPLNDGCEACITYIKLLTFSMRGEGENLELKILKHKC